MKQRVRLKDRLRIRWNVGGPEAVAIESARPPLLLAGWRLDLGNPTFDVWTRLLHECDLCAVVDGQGPWVAIPVRHVQTGHSAEFLICPKCFENPPASTDDVPPTW